jgi:MFS family permease
MHTTSVPTGPEPLSHQEARLIVIGVLLPVFMGSLDQTILASALPTIGREFGDLHNLPWLISAYLVASTAVMPLYGKVADIRGRQFALRIAIAAHMAGSLICAFAPDMLVLIIGRALQGIGGGGLASMGSVVLGDVTAPKERGKYYAYFSITYTTAGACGPLVGGALADHLHWSAIFWLNIPMDLIAFVITARLLRRLPRHERPHRLDLMGALLIVVASISFMLGLNLGGIRFAWASLPIVALFATALAVGALFVLRLATAPEPLIPIAILREPVVRLAVLSNAFGWGSIIGLNIFLPMYLQSTLGLTPTAAGLSLIMLMVTLNVSAGLAGQVLCRVDRYKMLPLCGLVVAIASVVTLAWRADQMTPWLFQALLILIGLGFGPLPSLTQVAVQNVVARHQFGISIGALNFTRHLVSAMLVALFGAMVLGSGDTDSLATNLRDTLPQGAAQAAAFSRVFFAVAIGLAIAFVALLVLEEKPLQASLPQDST